MKQNNLISRSWRFPFSAWLLMFCAFAVSLNAQTTLNTTATAGWSNNNGSGTVTFNFQNTNAYPIIITTVEGVTGTAGVQTAALWVKTTPINGAPGQISVANGWTQMATGTFTGVANTTTLTTQTFLSGQSITVPAGVTYGMAVTCYTTSGTQRYHTMVSPNIPLTTVSGGGCNILMGTNISYAGGLPPTAPTNTPRGWIGKLTFIAASPCSSPPVPGTPAATLTNVCSGQSSVLSVTGGSGGTGQTYQWETSTTLAGPYTNIGGSLTSSTYTINPTSSAYYRCKMTCGGNTSTTGSILVTVPPPFPGGNYTINSALPTGGTNFQSFTAAAAAIGCGISGPVVFDVDPASGPYTEQITLPSTIGSNAVKTVTFNGNGRKIRFSSTDANNRHVIKIDGADYITINDLVIDTALAVPTYHWGIHLLNGADNNTISLCTINTNRDNTTAGNFQPIVMSNSVTSTTTAGVTGSNNTFIDNTLTGGYYGITLCGNATGTEGLGNVISNNTIRDFYAYGVYVLYQKSGSISTCDFSRPTRTTSTTVASVLLTTGAIGMNIENCRIHNFFDAMLTNTSACYAIYDAADGTAAFPNRLVNNLIYNMNGEGIMYGIYNSGADYMNAYHNTISLDYLASASSSVTYGFYQTTLATGINFRNNIITIKRGGSGAKVGLYFGTTTSTIVSNRNAIYLASAGIGTQNIGNFGGVNYVTLANWQTANGGLYDANSVSADPLYVSPGTGDFTPTAYQVNNIGQYVGVAYDIIGNPRSGTSPDPGAFEFDLVGLDASITWVSPISPVTPGLNNIVVNITNNLSTTITSLTLAYTDGTTPVSEAFSGLNITPFTSQLFTFSTPYNVIGNAVLRAYVQSVNGIMDDNQADDTTAIQNLCLTLNGNYTINAGAPASLTNFQSFTALSNALSCAGITGPVVVNVVAGSGPYNEQVNFNPIPGVSAVNTITINGNGNTLTNAGNAAAYQTLRMGGADYMIWNNLTVATTGATNGFALIMANASDNNQFNNCTFTVPQALTATTSGAVAFTASNVAAATAGNNGNGNIFNGCTMSGGYYCVSVYGTTTGGGIIGNQLLNCTITNFYVYGLYHLYATNTVVRGCVIERPTRATVSTGYGMYLSTSTLGCLFERNRIRNLFGGVTTSTSTGYGIYCLAAASLGNENRVINNVISDMRSTGAIYGMYLTGPTYLKVYHNTISLDHNASTSTGVTYGIYNTGATSIDIQDNIVSITRGGTGTKYCAYYSTLPTITNYNNFFLNAAAGTNYVAYDGTTSFATLAAYQAIQVTKDINSVSLNPQYNDPLNQNFQPTSASLNNTGSNVGVLVDITGATRNNPPDMGAYEFEVYAIDAGVVAIVGPNSSGCYSAAEPVTVTLKNFGFNTLDFSTTPCTITCAMTGPISATITGSPSGTLAPGATINVTLTGGLDMTANGTYTLTVSSSIAGDGNTANDALSPAPSRVVGPVGGTITSTTPSLCVTGTPVLTLSGNYGGAIQWQESAGPTGPWSNVGSGGTTYTPSGPVTQTTYYQAIVSCNGNTAISNTYTVTVNNPQLLSTTPGSRCGIGTVTLGATAVGSGIPTWYASPSASTPLGTGTSFVTPVIASTTNFYVASAIGGSGGSTVAPMPALGTPFSGNVRGLWFTSPTNFTITGLNVPLTGTSQSIAVIKFNGNLAPPVYATTTNAFTTLFLTQNNPNTGVIPVNIPIQTGDVIGILSQMGTNTAYAAVTGPQTTTINGQTVTITRLGMQFPLGTTAPQDVWQEVSAAIGVINITYTTGCEGPRTAVTATVTPPPSMTVTAANPVICPGGSTTLSVSSPNDPNYSYSWTSAPAGFTATGAGPHTVTPSATTKYYLYAIDNTAGPSAGCANLDSVTVITGATLSGGTVSTSMASYCVSGTPTLSVTGATGGVLQWQQSTISSSGPWTNVGTGTNTYIPAIPLTQTTYFRVEVSCPSNSAQSNVVTVTINNPQVLTTTPGSRCGYGSVTLGATVPANTILKWYANATGGAPLYTGSPFNTPNIAATTTFYAEATEGLGGADSIAIPLANGTTTGVYHHMFVVSSPTGLTLNAIGIKCNMAIGTATAWDVYYRPDNYQLVAGANTSSAGWTLLSSVTNVPSAGATDYTFISLGQNLVIPVGGVYSFYIAPASGITHQYATNAIGTTVVSNAYASIIAGNRGSALFNCTTSGGMACVKLKYSLGCSGTRTPVVATVTTPPSISAAATASTICAGQSTTLSVSSPNDPNYTYTWNPGNVSGASVNVTPAVTTTYTLTAIDNTAGPNAGCGNAATVTITVNQIQTTATASASPTILCQGGNINLSSVTLASGYTMNANCNTGFVDISTTGTDVDLPANITDDSEHNIGIPSFTFNGVAYTTARVGTNGVLVLGSVSGDVTPGNGSLPSTLNTAGNVFFAPWWDDLYPTVGTNPSIKSQTVGNTFIVQWTNMSHFDNQTIGTITFQIQMNLLNGTVTFVYPDVVFGDQTIDNGESATVGIQYSSSSGIQYSYNLDTLSNGQCISFSPNTATVSWTGPNGFTSAINNPVISGASPLASGTYTVAAIGSNGCAATSTVNITVNASANSSTSVSQCAPPYLWNGTTYTASGTYTFTSMGSNGCDSIATLNLTIAPCNTTLNLTAFIQGYWDGTSAMNSVLANQFQSNPLTDCDSILVELHTASSPTSIAYSTTAVLQTNGTAACIFPAVANGYYYIVIKGRNIIETWSGDSVSFPGGNVSYNFSTTASQAYGSNQIELTTANIPNGIFAIYSGDIVKDFGEATDLLDLNQLEAEINNFSFGYFAEDLNGDGNVDILDAPALEGNISGFIYSNHP